MIFMLFQIEKLLVYDSILGSLPQLVQEFFCKESFESASLSGTSKSEICQQLACNRE
jgi:hypothetical protein